MSESEGEKPRRRGGCAAIGCFAVLLGMGFFALTTLFVAQKRDLTGPGAVLVLDLRRELPERANVDFQSLLRGAVLDVVALRQALESAVIDPNVSGLLVQVGALEMSPGRVEEVRRFLQDFRRSGKFVVAHADGPNTLGYLLATAADEILLDRSAPLAVTGFQLQAFFLKDVLAKYGIEADFLRVGQYKGAYEQLTASAPSAEFEEAMEAMVDSIFGTVVSLVATARGMAPGEIEAAIDRCPMQPDEAVEQKLADRLVHGDEVKSHVRTRAGAQAHFVSVGRYLEGQAAVRGDSTLAIVHVDGLIVEGPSQQAMVSGPVAGAETVVRALRDAADDPAVVGILLRIDSSGGAVSASEKIWRAVELAAKVKPVVASMGGTAASGGYYAACAADRIFAHRLTLTGSIGIFGGKIVAADFLDRHQVQRRTYKRGARAGIYDMGRRFDPGERASLQSILESSYRLFVNRVAQGREKVFAEIDAIAQGRVWTGSEAIDIGLVDAEGGFNEALAELRKLASLSPQAAVELRQYPERPHWLDVLMPPQQDPLVFAGARLQGSGDALSNAVLAQETEAWLRRTGLLNGWARLAWTPVFFRAR